MSDGKAMLAKATSDDLRESALQIRDLALGATLTDAHLVHAERLASLALAIAEVEDRSLNLEVLSLPSIDGSDEDCGWQLIEHYMAKPHRRVVAEFERSAISCLSTLLSPPAEGRNETNE